MICDHHAGIPFYQASNIIRSCTITKQPVSDIPARSDYLAPPFSVQVFNQQTLPYRYIIASVHIVVKQNGVILKGATSVVNPYTGTASLSDFQLVSGGNWASITYDVVSNGVICLPPSGALAQAPISVLGNSINVATIPSIVYIIPDLYGYTPERSVFVGVQSTSVFFAVNDANAATLVGVVVKVQVSLAVQAASFNVVVQSLGRPSCASHHVFLISAAATAPFFEPAA